MPRAASRSSARGRLTNEKETRKSKSMIRKLNAAALALALVGGASVAMAQTVVSTDITTNTTWGGAANPSPIILQATLFVKNGAILTILPGTIIRGQPRQGAVIP